MLWLSECFPYRFATEADVGLILQSIRKPAEYEKTLPKAVVTEELLREWIFEKQKTEVIFALADGKEAGFALFFHNFSTFPGRGYGKELLKQLAK